MKTKFLTFGLIAVFTLTLAQCMRITSESYSNSTATSSYKSSSSSNGSHKFNAHFHKSKTDKVKKILLAKLSNEDLETSKNTYLWVKNIDGDEVFKCKFTKNEINIYLDKDEVSAIFYNKINALEEELKTLIFGSSSKKII